MAIHWRGIASYNITKGNNVEILPDSGAGERSKLEPQPLYGIAIAAILLQNKYLVLHGSTVAINGKGVVIVGEKGFGKSTLTATALASGHDFICDDVTALSVENNRSTMILPGIPRLKLWPDAVKTIGLSPNDLPLLSPSIPKHILYVRGSQFNNNPVPLQTVVMLEHGDTISIEEMTESEKMIWLLGGQYFTKHHHALQHSEHKLLFEHCSELARKTRIIKLISPRDAKSPPLIVKLLEQYCGY